MLLYYNVRRGKKRGERGMFKLRNRSLARLLCSPLPKQTQRGSLPSCRRRYSHRARVSEAAAAAAVKQVPRPATTLVSRRVPPPPRLCSPSSLAVAPSKGQLESAAWPAVAHGRRPRHPTRASKQACAGHLASILSPPAVLLPSASNTTTGVAVSASAHCIAQFASLGSNAKERRERGGSVQAV